MGGHLQSYAHSAYRKHVVSISSSEAMNTRGSCRNSSLMVPAESLMTLEMTERPSVDCKEHRFSQVGEDEGDDTAVSSGVWFSEAALWTNWHNCGELRAVTDSSMIALLADRFEDAVKQH